MNWRQVSATTLIPRGSCGRLGDMGKPDVSRSAGLTLVRANFVTHSCEVLVNGVWVSPTDVTEGASGDTKSLTDSDHIGLAPYLRETPTYLGFVRATLARIMRVSRSWRTVLSPAVWVRLLSAFLRPRPSMALSRRRR